jgi:hypothetical protein
MHLSPLAVVVIAIYAAAVSLAGTSPGWRVIGTLVLAGLALRWVLRCWRHGSPRTALVPSDAAFAPAPASGG